MGPKFYCQLAPSMWRPFWGLTALFSWLTTISFWRATRWDRPQGRKSNLKIKNRVCIPVIPENGFCRKRSQTLFLICSYIQMFTLSRIETLKTSEYITKHTHHTNLYFILYHSFKHPYLSREKAFEHLSVLRRILSHLSNKQIIIFICWGPHSLTSSQLSPSWFFLRGTRGMNRGEYSHSQVVKRTSLRSARTFVRRPRPYRHDQSPRKGSRLNKVPRIKR